MEVDIAHLAAGVGGSGGTVALLLYFLKDFLRSTKREAKDTAKSLGEIMVALEALKTEFRALSKDLGRVEGAIDNQQKQVTAATVAMAGLTANIKALWAALQRIHPGAIQRRLSDEGSSGD